jgi:predicted DNA-binding transcriptional regulator AlpA
MTTIEALDEKLDAIYRAVANRHLSRSEIAKRLGVSPSTIDRRAAAGSIPRPINGRWLLSEVMAWEAGQQSSKG